MATQVMNEQTQVAMKNEALQREVDFIKGALGTCVDQKMVADCQSLPSQSILSCESGRVVVRRC
jgi:hypothetical protein